MLELFVFGTFWFWVLTVAAIIVITVLEEYEFGTGATICLLVYAGLLQWLGGVNIIGYVLHHPVYSLVFLAGYFFLGTMWGVGKWAIFVTGRSQDLVEGFRDYCEKKKITYTKPPKAEVWTKFEMYVNGKEVDANGRLRDSYSSDSRLKDLLTAPRIRDHKERFIRWLSFWPLSLTCTLLNDLVRNICRQIYLALADRLQAISDGIYRRSGVVIISPEEQQAQLDLLENSSDKNSSDDRSPFHSPPTQR